MGKAEDRLKGDVSKLIEARQEIAELLNRSAGLPLALPAQLSRKVLSK